MKKQNILKSETQLTLKQKEIPLLKKKSKSRKHFEVTPRKASYGEQRRHTITILPDLGDANPDGSPNENEMSPDALILFKKSGAKRKARKSGMKALSRADVHTENGIDSTGNKDLIKNGKETDEKSHEKRYQLLLMNLDRKNNTIKELEQKLSSLPHEMGVSGDKYDKLVRVNDELEQKNLSLSNVNKTQLQRIQELMKKLLSQEDNIAQLAKMKEEQEKLSSRLKFQTQKLDLKEAQLNTVKKELSQLMDKKLSTQTEKNNFALLGLKFLLGALVVLALLLAIEIYFGSEHFLM